MRRTRLFHYSSRGCAHCRHLGTFVLPLDRFGGRSVQTCSAVVRRTDLVADLRTFRRGGSTRTCPDFLLRPHGPQVSDRTLRRLLQKLRAIRKEAR